jgi:hypothetical protein
VESFDLDYAQKLSVRRVFRGFGWGTRTNVLLADVSESHADLTPKSYTDIDVLGVGVGPDSRFLYSIAYCTTSKASSERVFWLRGLREEFPGAEAILVAREIPTSARSLCMRHRITALTEEELGAWEATNDRKLAPERKAFEAKLAAAIEPHARGLRTLPKSFDAVVAYRDYIHLQLGHPRNLQVAISTLRLPGPDWRTGDARHRALLLDVGFIYALALIDAAQYVHRAHRAQVAETFATYIAGGQAALRDKKQLLELLGTLLGELAREGVQVPANIREVLRPLPAYTADLAALVQALIEQPEVTTRLPWYVETLQLAAALDLTDVAGLLEDVGEPPALSERCLRMVRDILAFLVRQSGLQSAHLSAFDRMLAPKQPPTPQERLDLEVRPRT